MDIGAPASMFVGDTADVVGNEGSSFMNSVTSMFTGTAFNVAQDTTPASMTPGQNLSQALGNTGEVMAREGSSFGNTIMAGIAVGGTFKLVDTLSAPPMTPEQRQEYAETQAINTEENRKSALMKEDARREAAGAAEAKRRAFFAAKP